MDDETLTAAEARALGVGVPRRRWLKFLHDKTRLLLFLTLLASAAAYLADVYWVLELSSHFRMQYLAASLVWLGVLLCFRDWRWSAIALVSVVLNAAVIVPWYVKPAAAAPVMGGKPLRVLLSNVYTKNTNSAALLELIRSEAPDVIVLQEVDSRWMQELEVLRSEYPHRHANPREDNFGIGLWVRAPLTFGSGGLEFEPEGVPSIHGELTLPSGEQISVVATHPVPPVGKSGYRDRNRHLQALAKFTASLRKPVILLGDLNVTMWSPDYARFTAGAGLVNARKGFGVLPTWPTFNPIAMIPLDHCLVSPAIGVKDIRTGPNVGSDHLPVIADLMVPAR